MRLLRYFLVLALIAGSLLAMSATSAHACSCAPPLEPLGISDYVFTGSVIDNVDNGEGFALLFEVENVHRGEVGETAVIYTLGREAGGCGIGVVTGSQLVITDRGSDGLLRGGRCSVISAEFAPSTDELNQVFGVAHAPDPNISPEVLDTSTSFRWFWVAGVVGLMMLLMALIGTRRFSR